MSYQKKPYIEPIIRSVAGFLVIIFGVLIYYTDYNPFLWFALLLFVGINLFQSGFSGFCAMEKMLKKAGFTSEMEEIRKLNSSLDQLYQKSEAERQFFTSTLGFLNKIVIDLDERLQVVSVSDNLSPLTGKAVEQGDSFISYIYREDQAKLNKSLQQVIKNRDNKILNIRFKVKKGSGRIHVIEGKFFLIHIYHLNKYGLRGFLQDITDIHDKEERINHLALHDSLTGLPNRLFLENKISRALSRMRRNNEKTVAVMFIDVDNFKKVNDEYGHDKGDEVLVGLSLLMKENLRKHDIAARWGGDEFVIVAEHLNSRKDAKKIAEKLKDGFRNKYSEKYPMLSLSIGIVLHPEGKLPAGDILNQADVALLSGKKREKNSITFYDDL